uniref:Uncharacterized protein n=1 Tax=Romanomermis culicivorax TaxID=13658 RepID=A0A915I2P5_ROMCU
MGILFERMISLLVVYDLFVLVCVVHLLILRSPRLDLSKRTKEKIRGFRGFFKINPSFNFKNKFRNRLQPIFSNGSRFRIFTHSVTATVPKFQGCNMGLASGSG